MSIKGIFYINESIKDDTGVGKKILSQNRSFNKYGISTSIVQVKKEHGFIKCYLNNNKIYHVKDNIVGKLLFKIAYFKLYQEIKKTGINFFYIRYTSFSTVIFILFLYALKKSGVVIYLEIPTYPYDSESKPSFGYAGLNLLLEKLLRHPMGSLVNLIITFSDHSRIWGAKTLNISNGVDLTLTPLSKTINHNDHSVHLVAVAILSFWHGYDRMIKSLARYYENQSKIERKVFFHIVGEGPEKVKLKELVVKHKLENYVIFHGVKTGDSLDMIFNESNLAIDSLGRHRSGNSHNNSLKSKEYIARGLPFIKSHIDDSLYSRNYYYNVEPDDSIFNLRLILDWYDQLSVTPEEIREDAVKYYSWDVQTKKIIASLQQQAVI